MLSRVSCPWCGSEKVDAEFVDVGVGSGMQVTPYDCYDCGAQQRNPYRDDDGADEEERRRGWRRPILTVDELNRLLVERTVAWREAMDAAKRARRVDGAAADALRAELRAVHERLAAAEAEKAKLADELAAARGERPRPTGRYTLLEIE